MRRSILRLAILACAVITIASLSGRTYAGQALKACKIQPKPLTIRKTPKTTRLNGSVPGGASVEYQLKATADLNATVTSTSTDKFKFDLHQLSPPKTIARQKDSWSGALPKDAKYILAVNNCSGKSTARYQLTLTID